MFLRTTKIEKTVSLQISPLPRHFRHAADDEGTIGLAEVTIPLDALDAVAGLPCLWRENPGSGAEQRDDSVPQSHRMLLLKSL